MNQALLEKNEILFSSSCSYNFFIELGIIFKYVIKIIHKIKHSFKLFGSENSDSKLDTKFISRSL